jgi:hypothetical protein
MLLRWPGHPGGTAKARGIVQVFEAFGQVTFEPALYNCLALTDDRGNRRPLQLVFQRECVHRRAGPPPRILSGAIQLIEFLSFALFSKGVKGSFSPNR